MSPGEDFEGARRAQFQRAQQNPEWTQWRLRLSVDLTKFRVRDVVELSTLRDPFTPIGLGIAELAAHELFPPDRARDPVLVDRWSRFVGQVFAVLLDGEWINAPGWLDDTDHDRLLPVVRLPAWGGRYILLLLDAVLAEPEGSPRRGAVLCELLKMEFDEAAAWEAAGRSTEDGR